MDKIKEFPSICMQYNKIKQVANERELNYPKLIDN